MRRTALAALLALAATRAAGQRAFLGRDSGIPAGDTLPAWLGWGATNVLVSASSRDGVGLWVQVLGSGPVGARGARGLRFSPGMQNGRPVRVLFLLPVNFLLTR